jgi:hypothetical protein
MEGLAVGPEPTTDGLKEFIGFGARLERPVWNDVGIEILANDIDARARALDRLHIAPYQSPALCANGCADAKFVDDDNATLTLERQEWVGDEQCDAGGPASVEASARA